MCAKRGLGAKGILLVLMLVLGYAVFALAAGQATSTKNAAGTPANTLLNPEHTYAVVMEMDHYNYGMSDLDVNFVNLTRMKDMLTRLGVSEKHIYIKRDEMDDDAVEEALQWLTSNSRAGDTIIFYIAGHGTWIDRVIRWNSWVPDAWKSIKGRTKVMIVNSCLSGSFITDLKDDSGIAIANVASEEYAWWGTEAEGLPIVGDIWTYYFTQGMFSTKADTNKDKMIALEEAFQYATTETKTYMKDTVIKVNQFAQMLIKVGADIHNKNGYPNPVIYDNVSGQLIWNKAVK